MAQFLHHPSSPEAKTRADYREFKELLQRRREEEICTSTNNGAKRDMRPEATQHFRAKMQSAWNAVSKIATDADKAGHQVDILAISHPGQENFSFYSINIIKGE